MRNSQLVRKHTVWVDTVRAVITFGRGILKLEIHSGQQEGWAIDRMIGSVVEDGGEIECQ